MTEAAAGFDAPVPLTERHDLDDFDSGEAVLDDWLCRRARWGRSSIRKPGQDATGAMRRNMPRQIPAVILGRLAIDRNWQGQGLGAALLRDAVERSARAAGEVAARLLVVHAISPAAEAFYRHFGFTRLPVETPTLALDLVKIVQPRRVG